MNSEGFNFEMEKNKNGVFGKWNVCEQKCV